MSRPSASDRSSVIATVNALYENKEATRRTSPRKRKDPPNEISVSLGNLNRPKKSLGPGTGRDNEGPKQAVQGRRSQEYDLPDGDEVHVEAIPKYKKKRTLKTNTAKRDRFTPADLGKMDLPERGPLDDNSPAKGTRSHGPVLSKGNGDYVDFGRNVNGGKPAARPAVTAPAMSTRTSARLTNPPNNTANAGEPTTPGKRARNRPRKDSTVIIDVGEEDQSGDEHIAQPRVAGQHPWESHPGDDTEHSGGDDHQGSGIQREEVSPARNIRDAKEEHDCGNAWHTMLETANKITKSRTFAKSPTTKAVINAINGIKNGYRILEGSGHSEAFLKEAEMKVKDGIKQLERMCTKLDGRRLDTDLVSELYEQAIPRSVRLAERALGARFVHHDLAIEDLEEILRIVNVAFHFCEVTMNAEKRPDGLDPEKQVRNGIRPKLRIIRHQYSNIVARDKFTNDREAQRKQRAATVAREKERQAEKQLRDHEEYQEALRLNRVLDRERDAQIERENAERRTEESGRWRKALMQDPTEEGARLRKKLGLPFNGDRRHLASPPSRVVDIDDYKFEGPYLLSSSDERDPYTGTAVVNGTHTSARPRYPERPKPRREPTADIPAEPLGWSMEEKIAFSNGLQEFQGSNRYHDILNAPRYGHWLRDRDEIELMQMALFLKQSMASKLGESGGQNLGDWGYLISIPG